MDILYVIGRGSRWNNNELRYSLRSLEKYGRNVGRIFIAGYCPDFINKGKITFIPCPDVFSCKHKNILHCIEKAVALSNIGDEFLLSSDDHFYVAETDFDKYPYFRKKQTLPDHVSPDDPCASYHQSLVSTRKLLAAANLPFNNFSWHGNTHFNKTYFNDPHFVAIRDLSYYMPEGCEPTCMMLNFQYSRAPFEITDRHDRKFAENATEAEFNESIAQRECISCASNVSKSFIVPFLQREFPKRSQYELYDIE